MGSAIHLVDRECAAPACRWRASSSAPPFCWRSLRRAISLALRRASSCARSQCISGCPLRLLRGADHGRPRRSGHHELRRYHGGAYERLGQVELPHSLGLLYEDVTTHLGFLHSSDEYKVMALAAFGSPSFLPQFRDSERRWPLHHRARRPRSAVRTCARTRCPARATPLRPSGLAAKESRRDGHCPKPLVA
jgi:Carbamoyltransferase N-terminus